MPVDVVTLVQMSIAILIPVLSRPERAQTVVDSITQNTTVPHRILFICSPDDLPQQNACAATGHDVLIVPWRPGPADYAKKINHGYRHSTDPYLFTGADDLVFHPGWDTAALAHMSDATGVVGTNDLGNPKVLKGIHSTHSLVARWYADTHGTIDGPGAIYAECYPHEFVDDEFCETAQSRNAYAHAHDSVVEHIHPNWSKRPPDNLTRQAPRRLIEGRRIYRTRRRRWNPTAPQPQVPISVIVATYGDREWEKTAQQRALPSIHAQRRVVPAEVITHHGTNLAEARNAAASEAKSPWLCFLDADDELSSNYFAAMSRFTNIRQAGLLNPSVQFIIDGVAKPARLFGARPLSRGNYLVIGTVVRTDLFHKAGGFDPRWRAWEDWALFWRVQELGGKIFRVPQAIYKAHWSATGRNNTVDDPEGLRAEIIAEHEQWKGSL